MRHFLPPLPMKDNSVHHTRILRRVRTAVLAVALVAGSALVVPLSAPAAAAPLDSGPVVVVDPASGATITLDKSVYHPGDKIHIEATGFVANQGTVGDPLVAVRPYDWDYDHGSPWTAGGDDAYFASGSHSSEARYWFRTHAEDPDPSRVGTFRGWMQIPENATAEGPLGGASAGRHWLRILSGAYFTSTGDRLTPPITFEVPFTIEERVVLGLTAGPPAAQVFQPGTHFRAGASVTVKGSGFDPAAPVVVSLGGTPLTGVDLTTDGAGTLPPTARFTVPAGTTVGEHTVVLASGTVTESRTIAVVPSPAVTVHTPQLRPGGLLAFDLTGYVGVGGGGQKVAVVTSEQVLACVQTDDSGAASGYVEIPALAEGEHNVLFNAGLSCISPPVGVINDQPISTSGRPIAVAAQAPAITLPATAAAGQRITVSGSGFPSGSPVAVDIAGVGVSLDASTDVSGSFSTPVTVPNQEGSALVLARSGGSAAAAVLTVTPMPKVSSRTTAKLVKKKIKKGKRARLKVTVRANSSGTVPVGTVRIMKGGKQVAKVNLKAGHSGKRTIKLPKLKVGKHTLHAVYVGQGAVTGSKSAEVKLRVVRR